MTTYPFGNNNGRTTMTCGDLSMVFNMPAALTSHGAGEDEWVQGLPPYNQQPAYLVEDLLAAAASLPAADGAIQAWLDTLPRTEGKTSSYVVGVKKDHGMWLDFNPNAWLDHEVAALVSVQGVNAVTGQSTLDGGDHLEQYKYNCPVHNVRFDAGRRCAQCGYEWPSQNYLATTGTPRGMFWLDGFRTADSRGVTRQFVFRSEDANVGVAQHIIGERRVYAIGVAFYKSVAAKPPQPIARMRGFACAYESKGVGTLGDLADSPMLYSMSMDAPDRSAGIEMESLEVAAGARIHQAVYADPKDIAFWQGEPSGIILVNYTTQAVLQKLLAQSGGPRTTTTSEGFLDGLPVGNNSNNPFGGG